MFYFMKTFTKKSVQTLTLVFLFQFLAFAPAQAANMCKIVNPGLLAKQIKEARQKTQYFKDYSQALLELHQEASRDARISANLMLGSVLLPITSWLSFTLMAGAVLSLPQFFLAAGEYSTAQGVGEVVYNMALFTGLAQGAAHEGIRITSLLTSSESQSDPELSKEVALIYSLDELKKTDGKINQSLAPWPKDHTQLEDMLSLGRKDVQYLESALKNINAHQQVSEKRQEILNLLQMNCRG